MQTSMTIATLLAFVCSANAATLVRERTQQLHKSAGAASTGARLWTEEEDPFRRLQTTAEDGSMSMSVSMSTAATPSMSYPEVEEIPDVGTDTGDSEEGDREVGVDGSGAMTVGTAVSALAAAGAMMFL